MNKIENKTREQLLEILMKEYPQKEKSYLEKLAEQIQSLSKCLVIKFLNKRKT
jgi:hypothetical protein